MEPVERATAKALPELAVGEAYRTLGARSISTIESCMFGRRKFY